MEKAFSVVLNRAVTTASGPGNRVDGLATGRMGVSGLVKAVTSVLTCRYAAPNKTSPNGERACLR